MKTTRKTTQTLVAAGKSKRATRKVEIPEVMDDPTSEGEIVASPSVSTSKQNKFVFTFIAILVILALVGYKFKYYIVPAKVGNQPVFIWQYVSFMHQTYGKEALQTLSTQILIDQQIANAKVVVKPADIQHEIDLIDQQASASGGISAMLAAQQMTMSQLQDQVRIQLAVKQILKDKIAVTDAEVNDAYLKNKDFFKGVPEAEAKAKVKDQLVNQKFQTEASNWLAEVRKNTSIQIFFPGLQ